MAGAGDNLESFGLFDLSSWAEVKNNQCLSFLWTISAGGPNLVTFDAQQKKLTINTSELRKLGVVVETEPG